MVPNAIYKLRILQKFLRLVKLQIAGIPEHLILSKTEHLENLSKIRSGSKHLARRNIKTTAINYILGTDMGFKGATLVFDADREQRISLPRCM